VSLAEAGSGVADDTLLVREIDAADADAGTWYVLVIVAVSPAASVPSAHGKLDAHVPEFDTNTSPAGVGDATTTNAASDAPSFVTMVV
jgi:hypothetical protein